MLCSNVPAAACCALLAVSVAAQDFRPATFLQTNRTLPSAAHYRRDLNGNGSDDLVMEVLTGPDAGIYVLLDPGMTATSGVVTTVLLATQVSFFGGLPQVMGFADMNADGFADIVVEFESPFSGSDVLYLPGNGQGGFGASVVLASVNNFTTTTLGDFDGNGWTDFAYVAPGSPASVVIRLQNAGAFTTGLTVPGFPAAMVAGDYDGDGDDELALNFAGNMQVVLGGPTLGAAVPFTVSPGLSLGYAQDLDRDGREDLVLQTSSTPPWLVHVFFGDVATTLTAPTNVIPGGGPNGSDYIGPFDVDGDGTDEILAAVRNTSGYTLIRHDAARGFSPQPYATTMVGALIDLDRDGDLDQLVPAAAGNGYQRLENLAIYGDACTGSAGAPTLDIASAIPGNAAFTVSIAQARGNALAVLFVSLAGTPAPCGPQLDGTQLLGPGLVAVTSAAGTATWALPLPAGLPAGPYFLQAIAVDPAGALLLAGIELATTRGRTMRVY
jgi:hypothetical protein